MKKSKNDNFTQVPNDIMEKFYSCKLPIIQSAIFWATIRHTYGYHLREAELTNSYFSQIIDTSKRVIIRSLNEMINLNIIIKSYNGDSKFIRVNDDVDSWFKDSASEKDLTVNSNSQAHDSDMGGDRTVTGGMTVQSLGGVTVQSLGGDRTVTGGVTVQSPLAPFKQSSNNGFGEPKENYKYNYINKVFKNTTNLNDCQDEIHTFFKRNSKYSKLMDNELIDVALEKGKGKDDVKSYVIAILEKWIAKGYTTLKDLEANDKGNNDSGKSKTKTVDLTDYDPSTIDIPDEYKDWK